MKFSFTMGSDPEMMIVGSNGKVRSAIGIVPGTKDKKHKIGDDYFYYDNTMAECMVKPGGTREEMVANFRTVLQKYATLVSPNKLATIASHKFPASELTHKDALAIGCKRESCCYALKEIEPPPGNVIPGPLRSSGGHVHLGAKVCQDWLGCIFSIRMMDLFVGIPSIFLDKDPTSAERKELYGKAGRFRKPKHGSEYRSLSNFWIASPKLVEFIFDASQFVVQFISDGRHLKLWHIDEKTLKDDASWNDPAFDPASCHYCDGYDVANMRAAIDTMDKKKAKECMKLIETLMPADLFGRMMKLTELKTPPDLYKEWELR